MLVGLLYSAWLFYFQSPTSPHKLAGAIGILLGLYICSQPAANAIDLIFFNRYNLGQVVSGVSGMTWLALNLLTMLAGWLLITMGTIWLTGLLYR
jgi:hypothetical protein